MLEEELSLKHEIIVVDDNSPDGTATIVKQLSKKYDNIKLVQRKKKEGLSSAIVAGVTIASGDILVMDADLSHPPNVIPSMLSALNKSDLVIGSRMLKEAGVENWPFHRKLISKGAELLARILLGVNSSDPLSGFFAIKKDIFKKTKIRTKGYKILLNILADNPNLNVKEVPYTFKDRHAGKTKLNYSEILNFLFDIVRIKFS